MNITPDSVRDLLASEDFGQRLRGVNHLRELERSQAFELAQPVLQDPNARVRYAVVSQMDSLGRDTDPEVVLPLLQALLADPEPDVQAAAADAMGALKLPGALDSLRELYAGTSEWLVRFSIVAALGELGDPAGFELLQAAIASNNEMERMAAIGSLGELGDPRAVALLQPLASEADWQVRFRVAQALGRLDTAEARALLEQLSADEVEAVATEAKQALSS